MPRHFREAKLTSHISEDYFDRKVNDKMGQMAKN